MAGSLPQLSLGDLLAKAFHDFDNRAGVAISGGRIYGDAHLDEPDPRNMTRRLATQAVQAGKRDVEEAFWLGQARSALADQALFAAVRTASGATGNAYAAESLIPQPSAGEPGQNWNATSIEALWNKPVVGTQGPTVGDEITASLQTGGGIRAEIDALENSFPQVERRWSGDLRPRQAYREGFVLPLVGNPWPRLPVRLACRARHGSRGREDKDSRSPTRRFGRAGIRFRSRDRIDSEGRFGR